MTDMSISNKEYEAKKEEQIKEEKKTKIKGI